MSCPHKRLNSQVALGMTSMSVIDTTKGQGTSKVLRWTIMFVGRSGGKISFIKITVMHETSIKGPEQNICNLFYSLKVSIPRMAQPLSTLGGKPHE